MSSPRMCAHDCNMDLSERPKAPVLNLFLCVQERSFSDARAGGGEVRYQQQDRFGFLLAAGSIL